MTDQKGSNERQFPTLQKGQRALKRAGDTVTKGYEHFGEICVPKSVTVKIVLCTPL
jgi:hypothetical protein